MSLIKLQGNPSGTGAFTIAAPNGNTDRTLTLPDNTGTILTSASTSVLPKGGPAFSAYKSSGPQVISDAVATKVTFDVEEFDTNSNFSSSRFTPTVAGYYQVNSLVYISGSLTDTTVWIYKNGGGYKRGFGLAASTVQQQMATSCLVFLNGSSDYIEVYVYADVSSGSPTVVNGSQATWFDACLVRAE